jgi:septation ring formation regulator EzrA
MHDMEREMARIQEIIKDFNAYLLSLKKDTEEIYHKICDYFLKLKDAQSIVRNMNVSSYSERLKLSFDSSYAYLEDIGEIIKVQPIDVQNALDTLVYAEEMISILIKDVEENASQRKYAEESIVYANQYRQGFLDCKYALNNAGTSFFEGDFTRTIDETVAIIKKMRPDVK